MFDWFRKSETKQPAQTPENRRLPSFFSTHAAEAGQSLVNSRDVIHGLINQAPKLVTASAQDSSDGNTLSLKQQLNFGGMNEVLGAWYASQSFIGYQYAAMLAQNWLINKCCTMPGRDAVRNGFEIVAADGQEIDPAAMTILRRYDKAFKLRWNLEQFIRMGRIFGVRIALFRVQSQDPEYYEKPFNPDGVTPGSYKGIVQVDPYWVVPQLEQHAVANPETLHFYEPTWWIINGKKYHRSHLVIFRNAEPPDLLKPAYLYGGIPVPQQIMERVYAAERVANEAPQLAQTKRTTVWRTAMDTFIGKGEEAFEALNRWVSFRDNYGVKLGDKEGDDFQQFDTSLADLDTVIMTQYQIVAAAANVPATKLLGTTPKGFNSTGEYEESNYHEELESIQEHDLTPLIERHHLLVMRSFVRPKVQMPEQIDITVEWRPVDSPTAKEQAETNLVKAQTGQALVASGAISNEDERQRIARDPTSGYAGIELGDQGGPDPYDDDDDLE
ncbi:DUF1073 domain-containing protein [Curvibacter lanceolatus]|uniref:phage portal protein n=1 Tax=Curvibacter lanceolatus TaxID=86182 RepID=UPI000379E7CB|nr:DUF1073 domain-containing protein [Curvibacter lanceolatus]